jgi:phospholipase C
MDRRTFVKGAAAGLGAAALAKPAAAADFVNLALPQALGGKPSRTPIKHIVCVMMENRSVDHFLGWYGKENPEFDGIQEATFRDLRKGPDGPLVQTEDWGRDGRNDYHGRGFADPNHGWTGGRIQRNAGACDGWLDPRTGDDELAISTYEAHDIPVWAQLTRGWQTYDRWHCSLIGPTQPNRYYWYSGHAAGVKDNSLPPEFLSTNPAWAAGWDWPTVWSLCEGAGVSSAYYFSSLPETAFWGARHLHQSRHVAEFFLACELGTLPQVSFIDPWFVAPSGLSNDDHPHADIRLGQAFLSDLIHAFTTSKHYREGAMVVTYDEWGGFWDHVDPPRVGDDRGTPNDPGGEDDFSQIGFRVPSTIISPWTKHHRVDHTTYEHASTLRFICENWGLPYPTGRTRSTNSIEGAFRRFRQFDAHADFAPYTIPLLDWVEGVLESNLDQLNAGEVPRISPLSNPLPAHFTGEGPKSDVYRLAETGWFDKLPVDIDHRFEDCYLSPSSIKSLLAPARR